MFTQAEIEQLIVKPPTPDPTKDLPCARPDCNGKRTLLKSGRYDPYCKKCRSECNRIHRKKRNEQRTIQA